MWSYLKIVSGTRRIKRLQELHLITGVSSALSVKLKTLDRKNKTKKWEKLAE